MLGVRRSKDMLNMMQYLEICILSFYVKLTSNNTKVNQIWCNSFFFLCC